MPTEARDNSVQPGPRAARFLKSTLVGRGPVNRVVRWRKPLAGTPNRTYIPYEGGSGRTPTGAMQFAGDWPGLFIRGDDCGALLGAIRRLRKHCAGMENSEIGSDLRTLDEIANIIQNDVMVLTKPGEPPTHTR